MTREGLLAAIDRRLQESSRVQAELARDAGGVVAAIADLLVSALARGNAVYLAGNGGSAADALHLAAELQGQLYLKGRRPLPVMALTGNVALLTAVANDLGYEQVFARQVEAQLGRGDVLIALSTSGRSPNMLAAARAARGCGALVIGFSGRDGGPLRALCDLMFCAPSNDVARIQESHQVVGHIVCEMIEMALFDNEKARVY